MRRGKFGTPFLVIVAFVGLATGGAIALAFTSLSPDVDFVAIILASVALAVFASSIRTLRDETDSANDPRNAAALPLDRLPLVKNVGADEQAAGEKVGRKGRLRQRGSDSESHGDDPS